MVGGLVEHDDVPVLHEQRREGDSAALAAAQATDGGGPVEVGDEPGDDVARAGVGGPLVLGAVADDRVPDGLARVEVVALGEHADAQAAAPRDAARVGRQALGEHAEQARLAVAVAADDADAVALVDAESHRVEDDARRVFEAQPLGAQQVRHQRSTSGLTT